MMTPITEPICAKGPSLPTLISPATAKDTPMHLVIKVGQEMKLGKLTPFTYASVSATPEAIAPGPK